MDKQEPRTFSDNQGRKWIVSITAADLKRVRLATGVRLDSLIEDRLQPLARLFSDIEQFVNVIYLLCESQADKLKLTDVDFGRAMVGDHIEEARDSFVRALADFSPSRIRKTLLDLATKGNIAVDRMSEAAAKELEAITPEMIEGAMMDMVRSTGRRTATGLQELSELIPDHSVPAS